mgnify:CR=1 FL=1
MDIISSIVSQYCIEIASYSIFATLVILFLLFRQRSKKNKYLDWKKDQLNLYVFKREWERNDDEVLKELFSENKSLEKELKELKKANEKTSIQAAIILLLFVLHVKFKNITKIKTKE